MGIYDRDYERTNRYEDAPGFHLGGSRTLTTNLVIGMAAVYVVQLLTQPVQPAYLGDAGWFTNFFSLHADVFRRPWMCFELLTYGFMHDPGDLRHILFNMIAFWFFGRPVEQRYGRREYLAFLLTAIVVAGLAWVLGEFVAHGAAVPVSMLGASGGISAVLLLFALNYPRQYVYIWGVLPLPAWAFAVAFVAYDIFGAVQRQGDVAYTAHLAGALFAVLYFQLGWRVSKWLPASLSIPRLSRRPKLRVLDPSDNEKEASTDSQVDEILRKIQQHGQDSLTHRERRILEEASREYQKKRQ
jgi:membrane associated rhomboid family serine protease